MILYGSKVYRGIFEFEFTMGAHKKLCQQEYISHHLLQGPDVPELLKTGQATSGDGTVKGHRVSLHYTGLFLPSSFVDVVFP